MVAAVVSLGFILALVSSVRSSKRKNRSATNSPASSDSSPPVPGSQSAPDSGYHVTSNSGNYSYATEYFSASATGILMTPLSAPSESENHSAFTSEQPSPTTHALFSGIQDRPQSDSQPPSYDEVMSMSAPRVVDFAPLQSSEGLAAAPLVNNQNVDTQRQQMPMTYGNMMCDGRDEPPPYTI